MKKFISLTFALLLVFAVGCSNTSKDGFNESRSINLVSREEGSGTRGAFVEIVGILEKDADGNELDRTYEEAIIQNSTDAIMTTVSGDDYSLGYISLGSLNDKVKALKVDGVEPTAENIQAGNYKIARPFNIVYNGAENALRDDFIDFILSSIGKAIVTEEGLVESLNDALDYTPSGQKGSLVIAGSTSVSPVMEKLTEKYKSINPDVKIEIQSTGSSAGVQAILEDSAHLGMVSREIKDSERAKLEHSVLALDGIALIVNKSNPTENISLDEVKASYIGDITSWDGIKR